MAFLFVCLSCLVFILFSSYVLQLLADMRRRLPPGPTPLPVIGNLLAVGKLPHRSIARLAERYGPLMTVRLGTALVIVASSPAAAREILQTHNASLAGRSPPDAWSGEGHAANSVFVLPPRHKWRALRRLGTAQLFSPRRLDELRPLRRDMVHGLLRNVSELAASGAPVDVGGAAFAAATGLLWRAMFSDDLDAATSRELRGFVAEAAVLAATPNVSDFFPAVAAADLQGMRRRMARLIARSYQLIDRQIERRRRCREVGDGDARQNDLLDVMLDMSEQEEDNGGVTINQDVMRAFFTDLFVGASDTSSSTIQWAMAELLQNPQSMRKLQEELNSVIGSKPHVEESDIDCLPYLQAVVKETLRLHPVVPLLLYKAEATVEIQGYTIPKGSNIMVNVWAIHRDGEIWMEPGKFIPERFMHKEIGFFGRNFEFIPFSYGKHICLGLPLANRMVHTILGSLLHRFEWTLPKAVNVNGIDMTEKFGLVLSMVTPVHAIAKKK